MVDILAYNSDACILLHGKMLGFQQSVNILNIYGLFENRQGFWDIVRSCGLLNLPNLILAGDFNFTLPPAEVWGQNSKLDSMAFYFKDLFENFDLIDINPPVL